MLAKTRPGLEIWQSPRVFMPSLAARPARRPCLLGAALLVCCFFSGACSRPQPPTITPEKGVVTALGPNGIDLLVTLWLDNPNRVSLSVQSVDAQVVVDKRYNLGRVTVPRPMDLPASGRTQLDVPLSVAWSDLAVLLALATSRQGVPYDVDGTVGLGGKLVEVSVPFHLTGQISPDQLAQAAKNSLPTFPLR